MGLKLTLAWGGLLLLLAGAMAAVLYRRQRHASRGGHALVPVLPFAGAAMLWGMWVTIAVTPYEEWNGARVAPVVGWRMGLPLYYPPGEGPAMAFMYPPVSAIIRLPATFASSPTAAVIVSAVINALLYQIPLILFLRSIRSRRLYLFLGLLVMWGFSLDLRSLNYSAYQPHADAPALGFGLLACTLVAKRGHRARQTRHVVGAAVLVALSIGSKQTLAPLLVALPAYLLMRGGIRAAALFTSVAIALLAAIGLISVGVWGIEAVRLHWFQLAASQEWYFQDHGRIASFLLWTGTLLAEAIGPIAAMIIFWMLRQTTQAQRTRLILQPWMLPLVVAIVMMPLAVMSIAKRGGWANSLSISTYFLVAALGGLIATLRPHRDPGVARLTTGLASLLAIALAIWSITPFVDIRARLLDISNLDRNPEQAAFDFARQHPGQAYFPRNPLATLMAEGRYYIFEFGLAEEMLLGERFQPTAERMRRNLPSEMNLIAFPPERGAGLARMEMPGFTKRVTVPELPGWIVYTRPGPQ